MHSKQWLNINKNNKIRTDTVCSCFSAAMCSQTYELSHIAWNLNFVPTARRIGGMSNALYYYYVTNMEKKNMYFRFLFSIIEKFTTSSRPFTLPNAVNETKHYWRDFNLQLSIYQHFNRLQFNFNRKKKKNILRGFYKCPANFAVEIYSIFIKAKANTLHDCDIRRTSFANDNS